MAAQGRGGRGVKPHDKDELLEERRRQHAAMRERRWKETKDKIKRAEEAKGKKGKEKEEDMWETRDNAHLTKVLATYFILS